MTIDGFLTFLALAVAVYAVVPKVSRRTIDVKLGTKTRLIATGSFILILILELYEPIHLIFHIPSFGLSRFGIHPQNLAFTVLIIVSAYIIFSVHYGSIPRSRLGKLQRLVEATIESEMYADLIDEVLAPNLTWICDMSKDGSANPRDADIASDIVRSVFTSPKLVNFIARSKPYFGIIMLRQQGIFQVHEFTSLYFRELISNPHSVLYFEVRNNQNISTIAGYEFPARNRLLHFLFADARNAEHLSVWAPIGEYLLLGRAAPDVEENKKYLNRPMRDFQETGQWEYPFAVGIRFIDLMVSAALAQNIQWHMWLWYFNYFIEKITENLNINSPDMEPDSEWPTIGYYLIYIIFSTMTNWVRLVEHLPADQANIVMQSGRFVHENGNIPKSAIMVMALCFRRLILSENVLPRFKRYVRDILLRLLKDTNERPGMKPWSEMIVTALAMGDFDRSAASRQYQIALTELLSNVDLSIEREARMLIEAVGRVPSES